MNVRGDMGTIVIRWMDIVCVIIHYNIEDYSYL